MYNEERVRIYPLVIFSTETHAFTYYGYANDVKVELFNSI